MSNIVYIAVPYSHEDKLAEDWRFDKINKYTAYRTINFDETIFSPISMMHPVAKYGLPTDWKFWKKFDTEFLQVSSMLIVLCLPDWEKSIGVAAEIDIMKSLNKPIEYEKGWVEKNIKMNEWNCFKK